MTNYTLGYYEKLKTNFLESSVCLSVGYSIGRHADQDSPQQGS